MNGKLELVESFHYPLTHNLIMSNGAGLPSKNIGIKKSKLLRHPTCPECGKKLVRAGVIEGVGDTPSNVFQCLNRECPSFLRCYYKRDGKKLIPLARFQVVDIIRRRK